MKKLFSLFLALCLSVQAAPPAPTSGQFLFQRKPVSGPFQQFGVTPVTGQVFGWDGSAVVMQAAGGTGLTIGTTTIASGTSGRLLYDNAGVLGENVTGTGVLTALGVNIGSAGAPVLFNGALGTPTSGNFSTGTFTWPTFNQNTTGSAATLTTARNINGTSFNGSADITVPAAAGTLTGTALAGNVVTSGLTGFGTITNLPLTQKSFNVSAVTAHTAAGSGFTTGPTFTAAGHTYQIGDNVNFDGFHSTAGNPGEQTGNWQINNLNPWIVISVSGNDFVACGRGGDTLTTTAQSGLVNAYSGLTNNAALTVSTNTDSYGSAQGTLRIKVGNTKANDVSTGIVLESTDNSGGAGNANAVYSNWIFSAQTGGIQTGPAFQVYNGATPGVGVNSFTTRYQDTYIYASNAEVARFLTGATTLTGTLGVSGVATASSFSGAGTGLTGTGASFTAGNATLAANLSGTPALPNGTTATTQSVADNSTKLATTAFVIANAGGTAANPTGTVGLTAVNGVATTYLRSDGAPALSQSIAPTWTGAHTFSAKPLTLSGNQSVAAWTATGTGLIQAAASYTDTTSSGTVAAMGINVLGAPTFLASSATTYTDTWQTRLNGPPVASTNVTQTRPHTLIINDSTSAASSITGAFVVASTVGTAGGSVSVGNGNINAGATITANDFVSTAGTINISGGANNSILGSSVKIGTASGNYIYPGGIRSLDFVAFNETEKLGGASNRFAQLFLKGTLGIKIGDGTNGPTITTTGASPNESLVLTAAGTGNITVTGPASISGTVSLGDNGTASATAGAATLNKQVGVITSEALTTAGGAAYTLTLTDSEVAATSRVFVSVGNGTNTTANYFLESVTEGSGSVVIVVRNNTVATALNGTLKIKFLVF